MTSAATAVGMLAGPAEPDQPAPVVDDEHHGRQVELGDECLDRFDEPLPGVRRVGGGVAGAGQVGRQGAIAGVGRRRENPAPHERGLREPVQAEHRGGPGRAVGNGFAVGECRAAAGADRGHGPAVCAAMPLRSRTAPIRSPAVI